MAGFNAWKNKFQRHVKKGEKGITILVPTPFKKKIEEKKLDPVTMAPSQDPNGSIIMEEREIEIPTTLHEIEFDKRNATPEEQEIMSRYVGWGALADAFDLKKPDWANEYKELQVVLAPDEYESAVGQHLERPLHQPHRYQGDL